MAQPRMGASGFPGKREDPILAGIMAAIFMIKDPIRLSGKLQLNTSDIYLTTKNTKITKGKQIIFILSFRVLRALCG
jgi:hypothetical protein